MRLILASSSPRRAALLTGAGFEFDIVPPDVDERVRPGENASRYVERLAMEKSAQVSARCAGDGIDSVVLGADTAVVLDGAILGKPGDDDEAREMLRRLSLRTHEVLTGVSVRAADGEWHTVETTAVTLASIDDDEIDWYVSTGEGRDKAGAYAVQGLASRFVERINGSYTNVVGLPIAAVWAILGRYLSRKSL